MKLKVFFLITKASDTANFAVREKKEFLKPGPFFEFVFNTILRVLQIL